MERFALSFASILIAACGLTACGASPPAHWARGGAIVEIPHARWVRGDVTIDLLPDGKVMVNAEHELTIDRGGRVFDTEAQAIALLEPDGRLIGPDEAPLGFVGSDTAALPNEQSAWLGLLPTGEVRSYDPENGPSSLGVWIGGCNRTPRTRQTCVLVTHLLAMRARPAQTGTGIRIGVGLGVGFPIR